MLKSVENIGDFKIDVSKIQTQKLRLFLENIPFKEFVSWNHHKIWK